MPSGISGAGTDWERCGCRLVRVCEKKLLVRSPVVEFGADGTEATADNISVFFFFFSVSGLIV